MFVKFLKVFIPLEDSIKRLANFDEILYDNLRDFCLNKCGDFYHLVKISRKIKNFQIRNLNTKIRRISLQTIGFVYTRMIEFPNTNFLINTFITNGFIKAVHRLTTIKVNLDHSHVTKKIHGYARNLCNQKLRENQDFFSCLTELDCLYANLKICK